jgi:hypothetical protein
MKLWQLIYRIDEMAFRRKAIVDKLRAPQAPINSHALKIIAALETRAYRVGKDLATMQLRGFRGATPMGFALDWGYRDSL